MDDLRFLEYMVALQEHGHFAHAARSLGITQPALSLGIKRLEGQLGARLFDRERGRVAPTAFGEAALRHLRELLSGREELVREISLLKGLESGTLFVVAGTFPAEMSGHRALGRVSQKHPGVQCRIELREWNSTIDLILSREADLALTELTAAENQPLVVSERINSQPGVFYCRAGHPLMRLRRPTLRDVTAYPWALVPLPPRIYTALGDIGRAAGFLDERHQRFVPAIRVETIAGAKQVVAESDAISAAPQRLIADEVNRGMLAVIRYNAPFLRLNYGFVYLRDRTLSPAARAFMAEVRSIEGECAKTETNRKMHA